MIFNDQLSNDDDDRLTLLCSVDERIYLFICGLFGEYKKMGNHSCTFSSSCFFLVFFFSSSFLFPFSSHLHDLLGRLTGRLQRKKQKFGMDDRLNAGCRENGRHESALAIEELRQGWGGGTKREQDKMSMGRL